jgi:hypothetical protein
MPKQPKSKPPGPASRIKWPRNGNWKAWLQAMVQCCHAIPDDAAAAKHAELPIKRLADLGFVSEALQHVNRFLRRLPNERVLEIVRMARMGAEISLNSSDLVLMEKYLATIAATEPFNRRKCDHGFSLRSVHKFRVEHGLLDPADALTDQERIKSTFERASRQYQKAAAAGDRASARRAAVDMETAAAQVEPDYIQRSYRQRLVQHLIDAKDIEGAKRCLKEFSPADKQKIFNSETLLVMGLKAQAIERARQDIQKNLRELRTASDPNIHFPVMFLCDALEFLFRQGPPGEARRWLDRALNELPKWPVIRIGWLTSSIYESFARTVALIISPAAADDLMKKAMADAQAEKRADFRKGAVSGAIEAKAEVRGLDAAIEAAKKLRSPTGRRKNLVKLLARARRWDELSETLGQAQSLEEAAEISWWITFELPRPKSG